MTTVRPIRDADRDTWLPLWRGYNDFYRNEPAEEVTQATFRRLCDGSDGFFGLVAEDDDGGLLGLAHAVFHPATWTTETYCYLEDLFVSRDGRGSGAGRLLIEGVYAEADRRGADRVYWHTQQYNAPARSLYDAVGHATSFVVYKR
ncbi:MAG: GNAT family N-acetyltransferase [Rubrobacter sp.]|nr:GNAT family N-acetyltransferase [Rubrobacter sp.]MBA3950508.1 GNAT family N-acetyltransferase [Rubrobacter sp.]MDQ3360215.1 GNAT family N-acetyltransferase [Actinomycetota bacterium]